MKIRSLILGAAALSLAAVGLSHAAEKNEKAVVWAAGDLKWEDMAAIKGAKIAVLKGDPKTGAYEAMKKLPAATDLGEHTHTATQEVLVISGTIQLTVQGQAMKELGPG